MLIFLSAFCLCSCSKTTLTASSPIYSLTNSKVSNGYLETTLVDKGRVTVEVSGKFARFGNGIVGRNKSYVTDNNTFSLTSSRIEKAKGYALYEATKKSGCDIILAPIYTVSIKKAPLTRDKFTVKVTGVGANITGVEQTKIDPNTSKLHY